MLPGGLPLEELLFFLVVPVCAVLGFEAVRQVTGRGWPAPAPVTLHRRRGARGGRRARRWTRGAADAAGARPGVLDQLPDRVRLPAARNGVLTGRGVVRYDPAAILGPRLRTRRSRTWSFGFALVLFTLSCG